MTTGRLTVYAKLEQPTRIYQGNREPVDCYASITYTPKAKKDETPQELFGPLKVTAIFQGRAKTKIVIRQGQSTSVHRSAICLFSQSVVVWNDSYRSAPGQTHRLPFRLNFPAMDNPVPSKEWDPNRLFTSTNGPLPPSFSFESSGGTRIKTYVEYRVGLRASMAGIHVDIQTQNYKAQPTIRYEMPRLVSPQQQPLSLRGEKLVLQDAVLLPEDEQPHGFGQKTKAFFQQNRLPMVSYSWTVTTLGQVSVGSPLMFDVVLCQQYCTAKEVPEVQLRRINIHVKSTLDVRTDRGLFTTPQRGTDAWDLNLLATSTDHRPFSKVNGWTKRFLTQAMPCVPSTFSTYNIALTYRYTLAFTFEISGKLMSKKVKTNVIVSPPLAIAEVSGSPAVRVVQAAFDAGEGSSSAANDASLPGYATALIDTSLPPPQYHEALDDSQPSQPNDLESSKETAEKR